MINKQFTEKCKLKKYHQSIKYMVHCIGKSKSDDLILEIYNVNIFLALNCVITDEKNEYIEQLLLKKMASDLRIKPEPFYKSSMLIALYSFGERDSAIEYLKELNSSKGVELHKVIQLLLYNADYNIILSLLLDAIYSNSKRILNNIFGYDYNSKLYCNSTKDGIKEYIKYCYKNDDDNMLILLIVRYEELIDFYGLIGKHPRHYIETLFNKGIPLKMYINKIVSHEMLKEASIVMDTFYLYSNSTNKLENKIALRMGEKILNSEIIAIKKDVENIKITMDNLGRLNLESSQIRVEIIDKFLEEIEEFNEESYLQLIDYEKINKYNIIRKKNIINKYETRNDLDREYSISKTMKLIKSNLSIEKIIYIYLNTKLCEYCNLEFFFDSLNCFRKFQVDEIVQQLSKYTFKGYIKKENNGEILIRCATVNIRGLVIFDVDFGDFDFNKKNIKFNIERFENRNFYGILANSLANTTL